jgi:hypothetical protein
MVGLVAAQHGERGALRRPIRRLPAVRGRLGAGERLGNGTARPDAGANGRPLDVERVKFGGAYELQPVLGAGGVTRTPARHRSTADARRHRDALRRSHVPEYRSPSLADGAVVNFRVRLAISFKYDRSP